MKRLMNWAAAALIAWVLLASSVSAEETLLWTEDFDDCSDWTLAATFVCEGLGPPFDDKLALVVEGGWWGPNYETDPDVRWNAANNSLLRLNLTEWTIAHDTANGQWTIMITADPVKNPDDFTGDFLEIRLVMCPVGCDPHPWEFSVRVIDEGVQDENHHDLPGNMQDEDWFVDIRIDQMNRAYSIDWTCLDRPDSIFTGCDTPATGTIDGSWENVGDGPFAEAQLYYVTIWGYASNLQDAPTLNGFSAFSEPAPPPPPPPPPPPREIIKADFGYYISELGVQFHNASLGPGPIISWEWSFGDGYGSRREAPFHTYACAGTYQVTLFVEDVYGNRGNVTAPIMIAEDRPLCGYVQRSEEGLAIGTPGARLTIPTLVFILLAAFSASTLLLKIDFTLGGWEVLTRRTRGALLAVSVFLLLLQFGYLSFLR